MNIIKDSMRYQDVLKAINKNIDKVPIEELEEIVDKYGLDYNINK